MRRRFYEFITVIPRFLIVPDKHIAIHCNFFYRLCVATLNASLIYESEKFQVSIKILHMLFQKKKKTCKKELNFLSFTFAL